MIALIDRFVLLPFLCISASYRAAEIERNKKATKESEKTAKK